MKTHTLRLPRATAALAVWEANACRMPATTQMRYIFSCADAYVALGLRHAAITEPFC